MKVSPGCGWEILQESICSWGDGPGKGLPPFCENQTVAILKVLVQSPVGLWGEELRRLNYSHPSHLSSLRFVSYKVRLAWPS